jgi:hypothetical protein
MTQAWPILFAFTAGLYFAVCQVGFFRYLEFNLSSTFVCYYATIGMWLLGGLVGLLLRKEALAIPLLLGGLAAYYLHPLVLARFPFDMRLLPVYLFFIFVTALYSGYFFRHARRRFHSAKSLFFHENNGFLAGYVLAVVELLLYGQVTQQVLPLVMASGHLLARAGVGVFAAPVPPSHSSS